MNININNFVNTLNDKWKGETKADCFKPFMRNKVQLMVEPHAALSEERNPLSACHDSFCRFTFTVINDGKPSSMNMRWFTDTQEVAASYLEFVELFEYAKKLHLEARFKKATNSKDSKEDTDSKDSKEATDSKDSAAYTLVFKSGNYTKGKTAMQVLKEDPENGRKNLESQRAWLEKNLANYPGNKAYIDAINEALQSSAEEIENTEPSVKIELFNSGLRSKLSSVLKGEKIKQNYKYSNIPCYTGSINFYPGMDYPLEVKITNFKATVNTNEKGLTIIDMKTATEKVDGIVQLTFNEALRMFEEMRAYYSIQSDILFRAGIEASEQLLISERTGRSSQNKERSATNNNSNTEEVKAKESNIKTLKFESTSAITKEENDDFVLKAKFINSKGVASLKEFEIIINAESDITRDDFVEFREAVKNGAVEFEIECFQDTDGSVHVVKFAA